MILYLTAKKSICAAGKKELKFSSLIFSFFYLDNMSYFRYVDNGEGPTKLFIGGVHGNEGKTSLKFIKRLNIDDFSKGQFYFYNFDKTPYISTIKKEYYKSEIAKCTYRQFTTGFYFGKTDQDSQIYDNNTYIKNCTYIGNVQEVTEDGLVAFEQKNKFSVGEEIECMNFDGTNTVCRVEEIYNDRMEPMESAPHPKMQLYVKLDRPVSAGMILRRQELSE